MAAAAAEHTDQKRGLDSVISRLTVDLEQTRTKLEAAESKGADLASKLEAAESKGADLGTKLDAAETKGRELESSLSIRTDERDEAAQERDALKSDLEKRTAELGKAAGGPGDVPVIVSADATAAYQSVVNVMDAARRAGLPRLTFAAQRNPAEGGR